jgi:hypothetical protein
VSFCAVIRATMSVLPPGANGTTTRTGLSARFCELAGATAPMLTPSTTQNIVPRFIIFILFLCSMDI